MKFSNKSASLGLAIVAALVSQFAIGAEPGWYGGASFGQSRATIDDEKITDGLQRSGFGSISITDDDRDTGYKIFGGYQFNKYFALESGYFNLGRFGYTARTAPEGSLNGSVKIQGVNFDGIGIVPVTDRFAMFGRAGVHYAQSRDSFSSSGAVNVNNPNSRTRDTNYKVGVGLQYAFTEALNVRAEVERYRINDGIGNKGDVDLLSVGLVYRFNASKPAPAPLFRETPPPAPLAQAPVVVTPPPVVVAPPPPRFERYTLSSTELFSFNSSDLNSAQPKLNEIADVLNRDTTITNVNVIGYTDRLGSDQYNQKLSQRRAQTVKTYLVSKGVDANRLTAVGKGESNPVVECSEKNRSALITCLEPNRRVEVEQIVIERRVK